MATIAWNEERTMDRKQLISYLQRSAAEDKECTPFCPVDNDIAAYVDGDLSDSARILIERHLPDCPACVGRVGQLTRLMRDDAVAKPNETPVSDRKWLGVAPQWAVAATVVLAVVWVSWSPDTIDVTDYQDARNIESVLTPPEILAPDSGVLANRDGFVIRWTDVPGTLYYEIRVVSDVGNLVTAQRVDGTEWAISRDLNLESGREYFIRVDAYLTDAKPISSKFIPFRLRE